MAAVLRVASLLLVLARVVAAAGELRGTHLRGCALLEFPYVKRGLYGYRSTSGFSGVAIDYLEKLRDETGFTIELVQWNRTFSAFVEHMRTCAPRNKTKTGLPVVSEPREVPAAARQVNVSAPDECKCDIGVGAFTMTNERVEKVDFLWPFANENHRMISRRSDLSDVDSGSLAYMFNTFSIPVWLLIMLAVFVYAVGTAAFGEITPVSASRYPRHRPIVRARRARGVSIGPIRKRARTTHSPTTTSVSVPDTAATTTATPSTDGEGSFVLHLTPEGYPAGGSYDDQDDASAVEPQPTGFLHDCKSRLYPRMQRLGVAIVYTFAMFIGQPCEADSAGARASSIHRISWRLLSLTAGIFLFCLYNASLTVLLFESVKSSRFHTLQDVKECVVAPSSVSFIKGGASQDLWTNAITSRGFCSDNGATRTTASSIEDGLRLLRERKADFFYSLEGAVLSVVRRQCEEFAVVGEPFFSTSIGFIVPKSSDIKRPLDSATRILREQDAFQSARNIAMRDPCEEVSAATITFRRLSFFFIAYFVSAIGLIGYRIYHVSYGQK